MTKIQKLRKHIAQGKSITARQSAAWWGYYRLADGIWKLRKEMNIKTIPRQGKDGQYAEYKLDAAA